MLERSRAAGVKSMIITGGSLHESKEALELARQLGFYATVGCHPTRSTQFDEFRGGPERYLEELDKLVAANIAGKGRVVAIGECGLGKRVRGDNRCTAVRLILCRLRPYPLRQGRCAA